MAESAGKLLESDYYQVVGRTADLVAKTDLSKIQEAHSVLYTTFVSSIILPFKFYSVSKQYQKQGKQHRLCCD